MLISRRDDGFELSDDATRLDVDRVHHWLTTDTYWATGRPREQVLATIAGSEPIGIYRSEDGAQVAFARVITDGAVFAYLSDVYVARPYRGRGLGRWLVAAVRDGLAARGLKRFLLTTHDAQGVYAPLGFDDVVPGRWLECDLSRWRVSSDTSKERHPIQPLR